MNDYGLRGVAGSPESFRFETLDAARGICALLVALHHFRSEGMLANLALVRGAWIFVDYFFVLSGFVIAHSYGERLRSRSISVSRFMGLRMGRIYPLHLAVLLAFASMELLLLVMQDRLGSFTSRDPFSGSRDIPSFFESLTLFQSFGISDRLSWNMPSWSIAAEIWTYLLFALIFWHFRRSWLWVTGLVAGAAAIWIWYQHGTLQVTFDGGFLRCVMGFGIGVLTYHLFRISCGAYGTVWEVGAMAAAGLFASFARDEWTLLGPILFAVCIFILAKGRGVVSRILTLAPFQILGLTSYSIYMVHTFVQARLGDVLQVTGVVNVAPQADGSVVVGGSAMVGDVVTITMLFLVVIAAYISYRLVEKPFRDLSRRWLSSQRTEAPA